MAAKISKWLGTRSHRSHLSGALKQDLEAWQGDIEDGGAGLIDVVEDEGAGLIVIVEDEGAGLIVRSSGPTGR